MSLGPREEATWTYCGCPVAQGRSTLPDGKIAWKHMDGTPIADFDAMEPAEFDHPIYKYRLVEKAKQE